MLLTVAMNGEWFELAGNPRTNIETRIPLRRLLLALAELKESQPSATLTSVAAFVAGWPGERATPKAAAMRVYTAIHALRRLGLDEVLVRRNRGYILHVDQVRIVRTTEIPSAPSTEPSLEVHELGALDRALAAG